jgi:hypothetical protein
MGPRAGTNGISNRGLIEDPGRVGPSFSILNQSAFINALGSEYSVLQRTWSGPGKSTPLRCQPKHPVSNKESYRPNIPGGMAGIPILPPPAIFFIIFCISRN